ncbi:MAG: DUF5711 family protein, partial [Oscillospiraceae bacterium]|nr:DUF5711 family protein [Oscillospiraceae bacterium]
GRQGTGFPIPNSYGSVKQAELLGDELVLLGPTSLDIYTKSAYRSISQPQDFVDPALRSAHGRVLLFDRGSGKFTLLSRTAVLYEKNLEQHLLCMDLNARGDVAAATQSEVGTSEIRVWNAREKQRFAWRCEKEYVAALKLATGGNGLAACLTGTQQAGVYARFVHFTFGAADPDIDLQFDNTWLYRVEALSGGGWLLLGDQALYVVRKDGSWEAIPYDGRTLQYFAAEANGNAAVMLQDWGKNSSLLRVYDKKGKLVAEQSFPAQAAKLDCRDGKVYLRFGSRLVCRQKDGSFLQSRELPEGLQEAFASGNRLTVLTVGGVEQLKAEWTAFDPAALA